LPPELPGAQSAALTARELWWVACAVCTAISLGSCIFGRVRSARLFGLALIVTPHVIGVPPVTEAAAALPDQLARNFAIGSLAISLIMWSLIGVITEVLMRRTALAGTAGTTAPSAGA